MFSKKLATRVISIVLFLVAIVFFVKSAVANWDSIKEIGFQLDISLLYATILFVLAVLVSGALWEGILKKIEPDSRHIPVVEFVRVHTEAWLLKYVPGQVGSVLGKINWGVKHSISKKSVTASFFYENIMLIYSSILIGMPIVMIYSLKDITSGNWLLLAPLLIAIPSLIIFNKKYFYKLTSLVFYKVKKQTLEETYFLGTKSLIFLVIKYSIPRILGGIGFVIMAAALIDVSPDMYLLLGGAYIVAGVVGLLALFVPSGIGVREAVLLLLLQNHIGADQAIVISVYARLVSTFADFILALIYLLLTKFFIHKPQ